MRFSETWTISVSLVNLERENTQFKIRIKVFHVLLILPTLLRNLLGEEKLQEAHARQALASGQEL
jgi:hypothetical protein